MSVYEALTLVIALLGAVIATVSLIRTRRVEERQERLRAKQEELTELQIQLLRREVEEQQKLDHAQPTMLPADVRVSIEGSGGDERFVITNWGYGPARNVDFKLKNREGRSSPLVKGDYDEKLPIRELLPGQRVSFLAAITFGTGPTFDAVLKWTNPDGTEQTREMQVALT